MNTNLRTLWQNFWTLLIYKCVYLWKCIFPLAHLYKICHSKHFSTTLNLQRHQMFSFSWASQWNRFTFIWSKHRDWKKRKAQTAWFTWLSATNVCSELWCLASECWNNDSVKYGAVFLGWQFHCYTQDRRVKATLPFLNLILGLKEGETMLALWSMTDGRTSTAKSHAFDAWATLKKLNGALLSWLSFPVMNESVFTWKCVVVGVAFHRNRGKNHNLKFNYTVHEWVLSHFFSFSHFLYCNSNNIFLRSTFICHLASIFLTC